MSVLEFFLYITLANWSIVTLLWIFIRNNSQIYLINVYWGAGFVLLTAAAMSLEGLLEDSSFHIRQYLVNCLVILWGVKLSFFLYRKEKIGLKGPADLITEKYKRDLKSYRERFLKIGLLQVLAISPIISINYLPGTNSLNFLDFLGFILFSLGFYIETKSNNDLLAFRVNNLEKKRILSAGLWEYSRHPNYFGHLLQWWAFYIVACNAIGGAWSFFGPLIMSLYTLKVVIKGTEKRMLANVPEYSGYINSTNKLIPEVFQGGNQALDAIRSLVPFRQLTAFAGLISRSENQLIKKILISWFCYFYKPNLDESVNKKPQDFRSFNDFFTRKLESKSRPINQDTDIIISPVDGMVVSLGNLKKGALIQAKGISYDVSELIQDQALENNFKNGCYVTIYLAPINYHRIHFPFGGTIEKTKYLKGNLYSVNASSARRIKSLYSKNERTFTFVKSESLSYGLVSVGAAMVGSIVPFWNEEINSKKEHLVDLWNQGPEEDLLRVSKGEELGYFQMGSTVILLFPSDIQIDKNFLYEAKPVKFGEELINLSKRK